MQEIVLYVVRGGQDSDQINTEFFETKLQITLKSDSRSMWQVFTRISLAGQ
jgi:hypothetical protein